jgi:hypothetical protein
MAGFTVPNATDYALGTIASLDQSEPDSLDFSSIADHRSGVVSGGDVSSVTSAAGNATPAYLNIVLGASELRIAGTYGSITGSTVIIPAAPTSTDARFDLIVAYNNAGTFQYAVVSGTASATNPVFPTVASTQIPLYAVYVKNTYNTLYTTALVVDKRSYNSSNIARLASGTPAGGTGSIGDTFVTSTTNANSGQSQVYVKTGASTWTNIATYVAMASANTASTIVQRDASGNFTAGTITATTFSGSGASLTSLPGANISAGTVGTTQLTDASVTVAKLATGAPRAGFNSTRSTATITSNNYTITTADLGKLLEFNPTAANMTITVPGTGFTDGDRIDLLAINSSVYTITIQGDTGVTVNAESARKTLKGQWAGATLINRGTNSWVLIGNLIA